MLSRCDNICPRSGHQDAQHCDDAELHCAANTRRYSSQRDEFHHLFDSSF
jgi:hypothetical protein